MILASTGNECRVQTTFRPCNSRSRADKIYDQHMTKSESLAARPRANGLEAEALQKRGIQLVLGAKRESISEQ